MSWKFITIACTAVVLSALVFAQDEEKYAFKEQYTKGDKRNHSQMSI